MTPGVQGASGRAAGWPRSRDGRVDGWMDGYAAMLPRRNAAAKKPDNRVVGGVQEKESGVTVR